ncbi:MAG: hypothetical protein F6J98_02420 [Moorea sp. SIO4G2]|nr:hypothetical protein [Moorena sp. SIO4G2]
MTKKLSAMDYSDLQAVMTLFEELQIIKDYYDPVLNEAQVIAYLEDTKGELNGKPFYRPYKAAYYFIKTNFAINALTEAEGGTKFTRLEDAAIAYYNQQMEIDEDARKKGGIIPDSISPEGSGSVGTEGACGVSGFLFGTTVVERNSYGSGTGSRYGSAW